MRWNIPDRLKSYGLLNAESEDYGTLASAKMPEQKAYCTSDKCCVYECDIRRHGKIYRGKARRPHMVKYVSGKPDNCPDCGSALLWRSK